MAWAELGRGRFDESDCVVSLHQRGDEFSIRIEGIELMNSREHGSEEALARLAANALSTPSAPSILVGGLGMGFTLRASLAAFGSGARIEVAEISPDVVEWNRGPLGPLAGHPLRDRQVRVLVEDVTKILAERAQSAITPERRFDAILLDIDNGPEGISRAENDALYDRAGIASTRAALRAGGVIGYWSASPDADFEKRLTRVGLAVERHRVPADDGRRSRRRHTIWIAR